MSTFKIHNLETAPEGSKPLLQNSLKSFGMIPNMHGVLAESPGALEAYQRLHDLFQNSSFTKEELTVVWQTINVENGCDYCVPAHTGIANMMKVDPALTEALRTKSELKDEKLKALQDFTLSVLHNRGWVSKEELQEFYGQGYNRRHVLEVVLGLAQKVISNYSNHIAETPVDKAFQKYEWHKEEVLH